MKLEGIHHVTCITGDAPGNVDFYTGVLGLRLVRQLRRLRAQEHAVRAGRAQGTRDAFALNAGWRRRMS